jgi:hypothetical protein
MFMFVAPFSFILYFPLLSLRSLWLPYFMNTPSTHWIMSILSGEKIRWPNACTWLQQFRILTLSVLGCQLSFEILPPLLDMASFSSVSFVTPHLAPKLGSLNLCINLCVKCLCIDPRHPMRRIVVCFFPLFYLLTFTQSRRTRRSACESERCEGPQVASRANTQTE